VDVGFVGLGVMGLPMSRHLLLAGHRVTVSSRSPSPVERAVGYGARDGSSPLGVAEAADVVVLCVPSSPDVSAVVASMLPALGPGKTVVDCSTIDPDVEREQHALVSGVGAAYLDAPLSGGSVGAENGTLTLMVGGSASVLDAARPALEAFSRLIVHVGGPGMGQVVKLCNNLVYAAQMQATAEAFTLASRSGADLAKTLEVLLHSTGDCTAVRTRVPYEGVQPEAPASNGWRPGFTTDLMAKDLDLALAYADRAGVDLETTRIVRATLRAATEAGWGREDFSALGKVVRDKAERAR
jgi:3-hydroxyisobutyrate dehydrogenase